MDQILMLRIRERAYHIWAANGGNADANWLRAETEILNTSVPRGGSGPQKATRRVEAEDAKRSVGC
jgi:hypothetical protein